jgi:DNA-binding response OmpR family regulator
MESAAHIWLIEDDALLRATIRGILERGGYTVTDAQPTRKSVGKLVAAAYDIVVTDIVLPDIDGNEVIRRIRAVKPCIGIVAMSGGDARTEAAPALHASLAVGATEILFKPFSGEELLAAVARVSHRCGGAPA